jgi:predicted Zn-dependent peptidase
MQYAVDKCYEEMCKDEPFGIYEYGSVEDLDSITGEELYNYYQQFLQELPIDIYITGDIEEDGINEIKEVFSGLKRTEIKKLKTFTSDKMVREVKKVKNIVEKMSVSQGKLSLGFRTNISSNDPDYYALVVYNGILGGGIHSKLFQNVREKASLAYYAFSRLERFKSLMVISSGIEVQNNEKAMEIILKQMQEISDGNISEYEYESTLKSSETGLKSLKDSQLQMVDFYLSQSISGANDTFETFIDNLKKVTIQEVVRVSKKVKLDTTYFLTKL